VNGREYLRRLERRQQLHAKRIVRRLLETPEQRRQREVLEEEERLRRVLAKIGLTPEEFNEGAREFQRKFLESSRWGRSTRRTKPGT
jgi:hypothetical protein